MKRVKTFLFFIFHFSVFIPCPAQIINTIAGDGAMGFFGDGGPAIAAEFNTIRGVAVDNYGNIYIADGLNNRIRKINTSGIISTFAGDSVNGYSGDGGPATASEMTDPWGIATDAFGNIYIADGNACIRKVNTSGIISTIAGIGGTGGYSGDGGPATAAEIDALGVKVDKLGNIYIADTWNQVIRKVNTSGIISTIAGNGYTYGMGRSGGFSGDGGPATNAELYFPNDIAVDDSENVYIADYDNHRIRIINASGIIKTFAGDSGGGYSGNGGPATTAEIYQPLAVTVNDSDVYIADGNNIRKVNRSGIISTFAGDSIDVSFSGDGGPASASELSYVLGLALDTSGNLYICDSWNYRVRKVTIVLNVLSSIITNVTCNDANNGIATVLVSEGTNPYTYLWVPNGGSNAIATGLSAGTYTVFVTDSNNIKGSATITITQPPVISISADSINATGSNCNGSAWALVNGGTFPYSYLWTGGLTTDTITNQCEGNYCSTVTDAHGCMDSVCVNIDVSTGTNQLTIGNGQSTIYPNPNNGIFTISFSHAELVSASQTIEVYNVLGEQVYDASLNPPAGGQGDNTINLSSQPNGIYLYRVLKEDGSLVGEGKVIIER